MVVLACYPYCREAESQNDGVQQSSQLARCSYFGHNHHKPNQGALICWLNGRTAEPIVSEENQCMKKTPVLVLPRFAVCRARKGILLPAVPSTHASYFRSENQFQLSCRLDSATYFFSRLGLDGHLLTVIWQRSCARVAPSPSITCHGSVLLSKFVRLQDRVLGRDLCVSCASGSKCRERDSRSNEARGQKSSGA